MNRVDLDWSKLVSVATDVAHAMRSEKLGLFGLFKNKFKENECVSTSVIHCVMRHSLRSAQWETAESVRRDEFSCENKVFTKKKLSQPHSSRLAHRRGLNSPRFTVFLCVMESKLDDLLHDTEV